MELSNEKTKHLTKLGILWGFIKYFHPAVAQGIYDLDYELVNILPVILETKSEDNLNEILEIWFDGFGLIDMSSDSNTCRNKNVVSVSTFHHSLNEKLNSIWQSRGNISSHYYYKFSNVGNVIFRNELLYNKEDFPNLQLRIVTLFRYWNAIEYFFPYKNIIGENWQNVLRDFIPEFIAVSNGHDYLQLLNKLITKINDTHAVLRGQNSFLCKYGQLTAPFRAQFIEDRLVVTDYYFSDTKIVHLIKIGDIIETIDGISITELIKKYDPYTPGSNKESKLRNLPTTFGLLFKSNIQNLNLKILRDGNCHHVTTNRIKIEPYMSKIDMNETISDSGYKIIKGNIGYVFPAKLTQEDLVNFKKIINSTIGLIIDFRCYPSLYIPYIFGEWLKDKKSPFAKITSCSQNGPGEFDLFAVCSNGNDGNFNYNRQVVVIVNSYTQSAAEFAVMAISSAPNVKVIGSKTAGSDGNISFLDLPGNIYTSFSGTGIFYPDDTHTQRIGIKIDEILEPTIEDVKLGKDRLLSRAIDIISYSL